MNKVTAIISLLAFFLFTSSAKANQDIDTIWNQARKEILTDYVPADHDLLPIPYLDYIGVTPKEKELVQQKEIEYRVMEKLWEKCKEGEMCKHFRAHITRYRPLGNELGITDEELQKTIPKHLWNTWKQYFGIGFVPTENDPKQILVARELYTEWINGFVWQNTWFTYLWEVEPQKIDQRLTYKKLSLLKIRLWYRWGLEKAFQCLAVVRAGNSKSGVTYCQYMRWASQHKTLKDYYLKENEIRLIQAYMSCKKTKN